MYRKQPKRIPTLLVIALLLIGVAGTGLLQNNRTSYESKASPYDAPVDPRISNITDSTFVVSFQTQTPVKTALVIKGGGQSLLLLDDLDGAAVSQKRTLHRMTTRNLKEKTQYEILIQSGSTTCETNRCTKLLAQTLPKSSGFVDLPPIRGSLTRGDNSPVEGAFIYVLHASDYPISARTDRAGLWVAPVNLLRSLETLEAPKLSDNDLLQILAISPDGKESRGAIDVRSIRTNQLLPAMIEGNSYNFVDYTSKASLYAQGPAAVLGSETMVANPTPVIPSPLPSSLELFFPAADNDVTPDTQPRIRGNGIPKSTLLLSIGGPSQTGKVTIASNGTWQYRPTRPLDPGLHSLSIQGFEKNGSLFVLRRSFYVLKSGEQVLADATSSATFTPTPTKTITPTPTQLPSLTPTQSAPSPTLSNSSPTPTLKPVVTVTPPSTGGISTSISLILCGILLFGIGAWIKRPRSHY